MKARVKATGELLEVRLRHIDTEHPYICDMQGECGTLWKESELEFLDADPDYWIHLEHQAAIAAMQGMLNNSLLITSLFKANKSHDDIVAEVTGTAIRYAHDLVEKIKEAKA